MGILIASKRDGFRRAGVEHSSTPTLYADNHFTDEQLAALEAEPLLVVHHVEDEPEGVKEPETPEPEAPKVPKRKTKEAKGEPPAKDETPEGEA